MSLLIFMMRLEWTKNRVESHEPKISLSSDFRPWIVPRSVVLVSGNAGLEQQDIKVSISCNGYFIPVEGDANDSSGPCWCLYGRLSPDEG